jgi:SAM-dependent methyltransferase
VFDASRGRRATRGDYSAAMVGDEDLRCPATGARLRRVGAVMRTEDGTREYAVVDGVAVLIAPEKSPFGTPAQPEPRPSLARRLAARLPRDTRNVGTDALVARLRTLLPDRPRILVVGGGTLGAGTAPLLDDPAVDATETDVWLGPRTQLVCDGHDLPFADATFDAVVCQAVLEHVLDPPRVVAELHRVLRPDGLLYAEIPFMQQVHEGANDLTRYTYVGQRRLFREFDEIAAGAVCGPAMALAWSLRYLAVTIFGRRAAHLVPVLTFWLPRLDRWLIARPGALDAASSIGFLGRRRETPLADAEILAAYRGVNATPSR